MTTSPHHARAIGEKLRSVRQDHKMSLRELAAKADISASMLSQIETGKVFPSVRSLYDIATALGVNVDYFFPDQNHHTDEEPASLPAGELTASEMRSARLKEAPVAVAEFTQPISATPIVHAHSRPTIELNGGVTWSRLTVSAETEAEFLEINYAPDAASGANMSHHGGREFGFVLEGELVVELGFEAYTLKTGDSIIFDSNTPHRLSNKGITPTRAVWVVLNQH
jgi:transcriptional regulator with XRE-family HTH domain/quercetin dioxygenase-like cupin family protein